MKREGSKEEKGEKKENRRGFNVVTRFHFHWKKRRNASLKEEAVDETVISHWEV